MHLVLVQFCNYPVYNLSYGVQRDCQFSLLPRYKVTLNISRVSTWISSVVAGGEEAALRKHKTSFREQQIPCSQKLQWGHPTQPPAMVTLISIPILHSNNLGKPKSNLLLILITNSNRLFLLCNSCTWKQLGNSSKTIFF